jgi:CubicO group peptidase (beta-lactamase class C family)
MTDWLDAALAYAGKWIDYQMMLTGQPGCVVAAAEAGEVVFEQAFGVADATTGEALTPAHRFRVASHSKTFTAAAVMKLRDMGRLRLDERIGAYVSGLAQPVADATIAQLLSHSSGLLRDGRRSPHWQVKAPFFDAAALRDELEQPLALESNTRFKYSNLGFGLLGFAIEAITGEAYESWIAREIVAASGLRQTTPDVPLADGIPAAAGHSCWTPIGRGKVDGTAPTFALAAATGFVSTAGDLARFYGTLDPAAERSVLSVASRREMTRRHWSIPHTAETRDYGLGTLIMDVDGHTLVGHSGSFPGFITRSALLPEWGISLSVVTNAADGPAHSWLEGIVSILHRFAQHGAPSARTADWTGRWWSLWSPIDLVPMGDRVLVASPAALRPFREASELDVADRTRGVISLAYGLANHGERVERKFDSAGAVAALFLGSGEWVADPKRLAASFG